MKDFKGFRNKPKKKQGGVWWKKGERNIKIFISLIDFLNITNN